MIEAIAERILARFGSGDVVPELAQDLGAQLGEIFRSNPDRPEVEPEAGVNDMEEDRRRSARGRPSSATVTQANFTPAIGRNAVRSSVNIDAAITQWNARAAPASDA